ncbi:MAG: aminotransferase class V-fold PLP-dependent enzyme [Microbacterium sp.]|uniref:aminotransferase class V-fold PLP-dependent enzyme n=1 Tax=Microbacterium sp. TaxID=51671 RepID=UPI001AC82587|nr:aminotransferase class V-fold PLP-dependent enzyme [Microbacterium sp.]MBN9175925.1 aminotransferase class V-fold PLP-dependent enzyme [Microbacterium sp.]
MACVSALEPLISSFDLAAGYLDWARFGPLSPGVRAELHADAELLGTGRAAGTDLVGARVGEARGLVARVLDAPVDEIVLQPSTTQGLLHAMFGLEGVVVVPAQDFPAVRIAAHRAAAARGVLAVREIDPPGGIVTPEAVAEALDDDVTAVALSLVDYRTGALADLAGIRAVIGERLLIVDAVQAFGVVDVDWSLADVVAGNGYKWLRAGRGTGFARFSPAARSRIAPVLSGISGMAGDASVLGTPPALEGAAAYSVAPSDPLAAARLATSLREMLDAGVPAVAAEVHARAADVMALADRYEVPVVTPRDAHAGIVALAPQDPPTLAAALANHGVTVTARGATIRVAAHVGTGADTLRLLGDAFADAAASGRVIAAEYAREGLIAEPDAPEVFTIEIADASASVEGDVAEDAATSVPRDTDEIVIAVVEEN